MDDPDLQKILIPAIAIITAALIAGIFGLVGHWASRSNAKLAANISRRNAELSAALKASKVLADFRQVWINELREDIVKLLRFSADLHGRGRDYDEMIQTASRIQLRMNNADPDYEALVEKMVDCVRYDGSQDLNEIFGEYREVCQRILKREWDVLKSELREIIEI